MKKLVATALMILSCGMAYALPVGNPAEASLVPWGVFVPAYPQCAPCNPCFSWLDLWSVRAGYYGDYVFNRNLQVRNDFSQGKIIRQTRIATNAGYLALNIADKVDIFGTLGVSRISITTSEASWALAGRAEGRLNWDTRFSWSAGARGTIFCWRGLLLGIEGQYFETRPDLDNYLSVESGLYNYFNGDNKMNYREWQVGTGLSYAITNFNSKMTIAPYVAAKFAWVKFGTDSFRFARTDEELVLTIFNMRQQKNCGWAAGVTAVFCDMICFTLEGRWADEKGIYFNGNFRF